VWYPRLVIALYRRHQAGCKYTSRKQKNCRCPLWAEGSVHGEKVRRSLGLRNWEAGVALIREWELHKPTNTVSVSLAVDRFIADAKARNLRDSSLLKYEQSLKMLNERFGERLLRTVTVDNIRSLREDWNVSGTTMQKRLETVKAFFGFCVDSGWIAMNPATTVKARVVKQKPTLPFSDDDVQAILAAVEKKYPEAHPASPVSTRAKIKAFILVMLYSGIRISDCAFLRKERIKDGKLFLYTHKTGVPVWVPLPLSVLAALDDCHAHDYYFSTGAGKVKTWTTEWEERLKKVFVLAGHPEGHSHMLRDTFAVNLLRKGTPKETVAALLGNTVAIVEKHYMPWVQSRQIALEDAVRATW